MNKGKIYEIKFPSGKIKLLDVYGGEFKIQLDDSSIQSEEKIYQCLNTAHRELGRKFPCKDCREFPSQPNSEEKNRCDKCYNPNCKKTCAFYTYHNDSKLWQKTVEVTPKPKEKCEFCSKVGLKCIPEIRTPTHTSDEWEKEFEEFCSEFNESKVFDIKYTLKSFISSLLSQSEQRVRKEILEELQEYIGNYQVDLCENSQKFKDDTINLIRK